MATSFHSAWINLRFHISPTVPRIFAVSVSITAINQGDGGAISGHATAVPGGPAGPGSCVSIGLCGRVRRLTAAPPPRLSSLIDVWGRAANGGPAREQTAREETGREETGRAANGGPARADGTGRERRTGTGQTAREETGRAANGGPAREETAREETGREETTRAAKTGRPGRTGRIEAGTRLNVAQRDGA